MSKPYYTLVIKIHGKWKPEFGDYNRDVVKDEIQLAYANYESKIIKSDSTRRDINAAIAELNK